VYIEEKELLSLPEHRNSPAFIDKVCVSHFCFNSRSLDTTVCDEDCQGLAAGRLFSPGTAVSATNKTGRDDISEILLKVAFNSKT
jgi:hypothetical protein